MQDKQKVTLYLSPELHRQLKVQSAVHAEPMSEIAQKALEFYLAHPDIVDECGESHGQSHRVYSCPACTTSVVLREGEMVALGRQPNVITEDLLIEKVQVEATGHPGEERLVPC
jgi:hypothetical protein